MGGFGALDFSSQVRHALDMPPRTQTVALVAALSLGAAPARAIPPPALADPWFAEEKAQIDSLSAFLGVWKADGLPLQGASGRAKLSNASVTVLHPGNLLTISFAFNDEVEEVFTLAYAGQRHQFEIYKDGKLGCARGGVTRQDPCPDFDVDTLVGFARTDGQRRIEWWDDEALGRHVHTTLQVSGEKLKITLGLEPGGTPETVIFNKQPE